MGSQRREQQSALTVRMAIRGCVGLLGLGALASCGLIAKEHPQSTAKVGDLLVQVGQQQVVLVQPFRQGEPNGLFDGVVKLSGGGQPEQLLEINAVCSMPGEPNWPAYDNLYGKSVRNAAEAKGRRGDTAWQTLFPFNGKKQVKMGKDPGPWVDRLHDNLCRRGSFDDRKITKRN